MLLAVLEIWPNYAEVMPEFQLMLLISEFKTVVVNLFVFVSALGCPN